MSATPAEDAVRDRPSLTRRIIMDCKEIRNIITKFIHDEVGDSGRSNTVIGVSGGIDSSVVLNLAVHALGTKRITAVLMPTRTKDVSNVDYRDSVNLVDSYGVEYTTIPVDYYLLYPEIKHTKPLTNSGIVDIDTRRYNNMVSRMRMSILYDQAILRNAIVLGTTNKTEFILGYFTKYGDGGVDIEPIADIYKTEVFQLAKCIGTPENIINKPPSAGFGFTDEEELDMKLSDIDQILWWLIEEGYDAVSLERELEKLTGIRDRSVLEKVLDRMSNNYHKTHMPKVCKIGNVDLRPNFSNGKRGRG